MSAVKWRVAVDHYIETISTLADLVAHPAPIEATTRDADDDYVVALAREQSAEHIVTGDKDLLEWKGQTLPAASPAAFEKLLGG